MQLIFENIEGSGEIYLDAMRAICGETEGKSMLDIGCHHAPYTTQLGFTERTYVDILDRKIDDKPEQAKFIQADVIEFLLKNTRRKWDVIIASDFIEHLPKQFGYDLCRSVNTLSDKHIIFTPLTGLYVEENATHPDTHKSGWEPSDFSQEYAFVVFPDFHKQLNHGAFFAFRSKNTEQDFERVKNELKEKSWIR